MSEMKACHFFTLNILLLLNLPISKAACPSSVIPSETAQKVLQEILNPFIRETERQLSFYHYGSRSNQGKVALDEIIDLPSEDNSFTGPVGLHPLNSEGQDIGKLYLEKMAWNAFHSSDRDWELGRGLYTATEPLASIGYSGKENGFLLKVSVEKGVRYLDLRIVHRNIEITDLQNHILSCFITKNQSDSALGDIPAEKGDLDIRMILHHPLTKPLLQAIFESEKIAFTTSNWGPYNYNECNLNPHLSTMAMAVFQNSAALDKVTTEVFVPKPIETSRRTELASYLDLYSYFEQFKCELANQTNIPDLCTLNKNPFQEEFKRYQDGLASVFGLEPEFSPSKRSTVVKKLFACDPSFQNELNPPNGLRKN